MSPSMLHAKFPFDRSKKSIRNKYSSVKREKAQLVTATCLGMPRYVKLARQAHFLIGKKANIGTREENFDMKKGFIKSEAEEGLERISPAEASSGRAPIILACDGTTTDDSSIVRPAKVQSTPLKRLY